MQAALPSSILVICTCTTWPNLWYHVLKVENQVKHINNVTIDLAHFLQRTIFSGSSCSIIYCTSIGDTEVLANQMKAAKSHSKMVSCPLESLALLWQQLSYVLFLSSYVQLRFYEYTDIAWPCNYLWNISVTKVTSILLLLLLILSYDLLHISPVMNSLNSSVSP